MYYHTTNIFMYLWVIMWISEVLYFLFLSFILFGSIYVFFFSFWFKLWNRVSICSGRLSITFSSFNKSIFITDIFYAQCVIFRFQPHSVCKCRLFIIPNTFSSLRCRRVFLLRLLRRSAWFQFQFSGSPPNQPLKIIARAHAVENPFLSRYV